jgi:hypothetical protein
MSSIIMDTTTITNSTIDVYTSINEPDTQTIGNIL